MSRKKTRSGTKTRNKKNSNSGKSPSKKSGTRRCLSACYNHITEHNYLCNNSRVGYCHVDKDQMKIYGNINAPKYSVLNYKWDKIKETAEKDTKFCYEKADVIESKIIKESVKNCKEKLELSFSYHMFGIFIMIFMASATVSVPHVIKKYREGQMTPYEVLQYISDKYIDKIAVGHKTEVRKRINQDLEKIPPNDVKAIGAYIRSLMRHSIELIETQSSPIAKKHVAILVRFIVDHVEDADIIDVLGGAACVIPDGGNAYNYMAKRYKPFVRFSSHYERTREGVEYGYTDYYADSTLHMLMGQFRNGTKKYTYFQFEGSPGSPVPSKYDLPKLFDPAEIIEKPYDFGVNLYDLIRHTSDFVVYNAWRRSIGSIGMSDITDQNPKWVKLIGMSSDEPDTTVPEFPLEPFKYDKMIVSHPFTEKFPKISNIAEHHITSYLPHNKTVIVSNRIGAH